MEEMKSKVYIKLDEQNRILRCEGGYTMGNIADVSEWVLIDEGTGDRYNLCQTHYFDGGLYTDDGICRWKYENGECVLRTDAEIEADRAARDYKSPSEKRRLAYSTGTVDGVDYRVTWDGKQLTTDEATTLGMQYRFRGETDTADAIAAVVEAGVAIIRTAFADE